MPNTVVPSSPIPLGPSLLTSLAIFRKLASKPTRKSIIHFLLQIRLLNFYKRRSVGMSKSIIMIEFLSSINQLLKKILSETLEIKSKKSDCQKFYYEVLFINVHALEGAIFLLSQFKEKPLFQIPFVSVMRDLISDLILAEYVSHKENDSSANIDLELEKIYSEHYRFARKQKRIEKTLFGTYENHAQYEEELDRLGEKYCDDDGKLKSHLKKLSSPLDRIKYIESQLKKNDKYLVRDLYLWYTGFSKIAHFGELTIHQTASRYASKNERELFENYSYLLKVIMTYLVGLLEKVCFKDPLQKSIKEDLGKIWNFEI